MQDTFGVSVFIPFFKGIRRRGRFPRRQAKVLFPRDFCRFFQEKTHQKGGMQDEFTGEKQPKKKQEKRKENA